MEHSSAERIQEVVDRHEIWQVLQRYGRAIDRNDADLLRSCYFDDAIEDHGAYVGDIDGFIDYAISSSAHFLEQYHGVMNHYCELSGDDAYTETYWQFTGIAHRSPHFISIGRYVDHFQRRAGEWRIASRVNVIDRNFNIVECPPIAGMPSSYGPGEERVPVARNRTDVSYQRPLRPRAPRPMQVRETVV